MKRKPLTLEEFARLGGHARAKSMTKAERKASARRAINARWNKTKKGGSKK